MVRRIPVLNAASNQRDILEGEIVDEIKEPSVFIDPNGKTYDASKGISLGQLPNAPLVQLPRTTWYTEQELLTREELKVVGYVYGPDGCVPIFERRNHAQRKNRSPRPDAADAPVARRTHRNRRARKPARATGDPTSDPRDLDSSNPQP